MPFATVTPEIAAAGEAMLWQAYDRVACPTLLLRGAESDLLSAATAQAMTQRGPRAQLHEFAGVGHAPTLVAADQRAAVRDFLLRAVKTGPAPAAPADEAPIVALSEAEASGAAAREDGSAALGRARAFAEPLLTGPRARHRRRRLGPCRRAWPRCWPRSAPRPACRRRPTWCMPATT